MPDIEIKSADIVLFEEEVYVKPTTPELVNSFNRIPDDANTKIISYDDELKPTNLYIVESSQKSSRY